MIKIDRELSSRVVTSVTLSSLRAVRSACEESKVALDPISPRNQEYLADAERLGISCANYLIAPVRDKAKEERWLYQLDGLVEKYSLRDAIPRIAEDPYDIYVCAYADFLEVSCKKSLRPENLNMIERDVLIRNRANFSLRDLCNPKLMVFSPLSTDYLLSCLLRKFVEVSLSRDCFQLKPVIVNSREACWRRVLAIPDYGNKEYANIDYGEVFVENNCTGETMKICLQAIQIFFLGLRTLESPQTINPS